MSLGELLDKQFPPENHLVAPGLLDFNSLMILGGPPKAYKSFTLATMAIDLACGRPLFGVFRKGNHGKQEPVFLVRKQCKVLIVEQEVGYMDMQTRMATMICDLSPADRELCRKNIEIESCNFDIKLDKDNGRIILHDLIKKHLPDVLIIDPLREMHGRNENDATDMAAVFGHLDWLRQRYNFATIISHHTRKEHREEHAEGADLLRGSSYVFGKADSLVICKPASRKQPGLINLDFTLRRGKPIADLQLVINPSNMRMCFNKWLIGSGAREDKQKFDELIIQ